MPSRSSSRASYFSARVVIDLLPGGRRRRAAAVPRPPRGSRTRLRRRTRSSWSAVVLDGSSSGGTLSVAASSEPVGSGSAVPGFCRHGLCQLGRTQVRFDRVGFLPMRFDQLGSGQLGLDQFGLSEFGLSKFGLGEVRLGDIELGEIGLGQIGHREFGTRIGHSEIGHCKIGHSEVGHRRLRGGRRHCADLDLLIQDVVRVRGAGVEITVRREGLVRRRVGSLVPDMASTRSRASVSSSVSAFADRMNQLSASCSTAGLQQQIGVGVGEAGMFLRLVQSESLEVRQGGVDLTEVGPRAGDDDAQLCRRLGSSSSASADRDSSMARSGWPRARSQSAITARCPGPPPIRRAARSSPMASAHSPAR